MESILTSIKKMLGIAEEYEHFDADLISHINSAFMVLTQLGVGPAEGYVISNKSNTWDEFLEDETKLAAVKTYMHKKVGLFFDPPTGSALMDATKSVVNELEWRLNVEAETPTTE